MPLQPVHKINSAGMIANTRDLPFNDTVIVSIDRMSMFATHNSRLFLSCRQFFQHHRVAAVSTLLLYALVQSVFAQTKAVSDRKSYIAYADKVLAAARERFQVSPTNSEASWHFARACFERAEFAANDTERATLAVEGIVRASLNRGYEMFVVEDCCAGVPQEWHDWSIANTLPLMATIASASAIEAAGGRYVEAAVMSPVPPKRLATSMLLGGPHAQAFLPLASELGLSSCKPFSGEAELRSRNQAPSARPPLVSAIRL